MRVRIEAALGSFVIEEALRFVKDLLDRGGESMCSDALSITINKAFQPGVQRVVYGGVYVLLLKSPSIGRRRRKGMIGAVTFAPGAVAVTIIHTMQSNARVVIGSREPKIASSRPVASCWTRGSGRGARRGEWW